MKPLYYTTILLSLLLMSGCAVSRSEINVGTPMPSTINNNIDKHIVLTASYDARIFHDNPATPDIPSLGSGGIANNGVEIRTRAIGRKRNGYGKALGDVLLPQGQSVSQLIDDRISTTLSTLGYTIVKADISSKETPVVKVDIYQFLSWLDVAFTHLTVNTRIMTKISVNGSQPLDVNTTISLTRMVVPDSAWKENINGALADYSNKALPAFKELGL